LKSSLRRNHNTRMNALLDWMDHRTGVRRLLREGLYENIPGGSRWRYVWGSTLAFTFFVQMVTGIALWMAYSPSSQTAWESVYFIQYEMAGGWLLRGIHHYTAQAMIVLLILHLMQVIIDGAYKAPREFNFWTGLILMKLILALSLTGYLLPWDQKGYWATRVATNLIVAVPYIGPELQTIVIGGSDYGHHTLTRFFALHAGVLPALVIVFIVLHIYLFRRHGITPKTPLRRRDQYFWPDQLLKDAVACLAVLMAVVMMVMWHRVNGEVGAPLHAPADPSQPFDAARPEWYFLFLFQMLKYFDSQLIGALVIPGAVVAVIALMPVVGRWKLGHGFNVAFMFALLACCGWLTFQAMWKDINDPEYARAVHLAEMDGRRVIELSQAPEGIPVQGAVELLRRDPLTQGPRLFAAHCASCHAYDGHDGLGAPLIELSSAPDMAGFASRQWLSDFFDPEQIDTPRFFGNTAFEEGDMVQFVKEEVAAYNEEELEALRQVIIALSAEAALPAQKAMDEQDAELIIKGREAMDLLGCFDCHTYHDQGRSRNAPTLTGYGSRDWLIGIIADPTHANFYGDRNDRMPAFAADGVLDDAAIELLTDWLRGDWYQPPAQSSQSE